MTLIRSALACVLSFTAVSSYAASSSKAIPDSIDMKCYVELIGGERIIHRNYDVPYEKKKSYQKWLLSEIKNGSAIGFSNTIYKVIECKTMDENFKNAQARQQEELEKTMG